MLEWRAVSCSTKQQDRDKNSEFQPLLLSEFVLDFERKRLISTVRLQDAPCEEHNSIENDQ